MSDQNTEFEVIIDRHDGDEDYFLSGHVKPEGAWQLAHADRATLIGMVKSERARADKAEAELARVREVLYISIEDRGEALVQLISSAAPIGDKNEIEGENFGITRYFMGLMSRCLNLYGERAALARAFKGEE